MDPTEYCSRCSSSNAFPGLSRREYEKHPRRFGSGALPGVRDTAWYEGACAGPAYGDLIADLEGDFSAQDIGHLIAIAMKVEIRCRARRSYFLEHHHALCGLAGLQLERRRPAGAIFHTGP